MQKAKWPHFNALQSWKAKFVTPLIASLPFLFVLCCLTLSPLTVTSLGEWGTILLISSFQKLLWNSACFFFLCHLFLPYNTISCYLRAVVKNTYFNLHSGQISSATWSVCATEHHILPCDGSSFWQDPSFQILTKPESCKLVSSLICLQIRAKPSGLHSKPEVFFWWNYKTEAFHFERPCSGCKRATSFTQGDPYVCREWPNLVGSCWSTRDFAWRILLVNRWPDTLLSASF